MIYAQEERLNPKELDSLVLERLRAVIQRVYNAVPMYRRKFEDAGVSPKNLESISDIKKFPFTTKADLRDEYPVGAFAMPIERLARIQATSGTTGKPILAGYTSRDIETWSELMARSLFAAGVREGDIVHNAFGYGLQTVGLGVHYGAERVGAVVVPSSEGKARRQIMLIEDLKATTLCSTPSLALQIAGAMREMGVFKEDLRLRVGIFGGEPWSENMRAEIEDLLNILSIDLYGLSEMFGPGVACECIESRSGPHIFMDHFLPEIINTNTGEVLGQGEKGELVLTSLTKEAFPLIRYRTRDITQLNPEPCHCGRTSWRMSRIMGRTDDLLIISGVKVFPSQIEAILLRHSEVEPHYSIEIDRANALDTMNITAEVTDVAFAVKGVNLESISGFIETDLLDLLGLRANVKLVAPHTIRQTEGKSRRVVDKRKL